MADELQTAVENCKQLCQTMSTNIDEFRKMQVEKFQEIDEKGKVSEQLQTKLGELGQKLDVMEENKTAMLKRIEDLEVAAKRHNVGSDGKPRPEGMPYETLGAQLQDVISASGPEGKTDPRLLKVKAATGLSETVNADGGFLVQTDFVNTLLKRTYTLGQVSSRVRKMPISTNANGLRIPAVNETSRADGSRYGGVQCFWTAEAGAKTASHPDFRIMELQLKKCAGLVYLTDELIQDAAALQAFVQMVFPEELNYTVENSFIRGTGAGQPLGLLNSGAVVSQAAEVGQATNTILVENIVKMYSRMYSRSRPNSVWFINQDIEPQLFTMTLNTGTAGVPVYMPPGGVSQAPYGTLMGRPVIPIEYCSTLGTVGDIIFADMSQYLSVDKGGIQSASSIHVRFLNDETVLRFVYRVDGQPMWNSTLTPANSTITQSPWVTLATRP